LFARADEREAGFGRVIAGVADRDTVDVMKLTRRGLLFGTVAAQFATRVAHSPVHHITIRRFAPEEIARWFRVPPHVMRDVLKSVPEYYK
jgi:hypothetical protein